MSLYLFMVIHSSEGNGASTREAYAYVTANLWLSLQDT